MASVGSPSRSLQIYSGHMLIDAKNLAMECAMARKLQEDSSLLERAKEGLRRWEANKNPHSRRYREGWRHFLYERPLPDLIEYMTDLSDHGDARRQADPFSPSAFLSKSELDHITERVKELFAELLATPQPEECREFSSRYIYKDQLDAVRQRIKEEFLETVPV